jgi:hypothetical protein
MGIDGNRLYGWICGLDLKDRSVIPAIEETAGTALSRILADAGYRGHNAPASHKNARP